MADKKKMSVAEMLAAARSADGVKGDDGPKGGGGAEETDQSASGSPVPGSGKPGSGKPGSGESKTKVPAAAAKSGPVAQPGSTGRPNVADILALARAGKAGSGQPAAPKGAAKQPAAKVRSAAKPKPAGAAANRPAAGKGAKTPAATREPRDTASILAAAHKAPKPGPMSKEQAASQPSSRQKPVAKTKPKLIVPPMPTRPAYVTQAMAKSSAGRGKGKGGKGKSGTDADRRTFMEAGFWALGGVALLWTLATVRFMFPNVLREPPSKFKVGSKDNFPAGQVQTKFKAQHGIWIVSVEYNGEQELVALKSVCTHLGCTPNWLEAEQKFKCPCHGSGYYKDGINFEGPAPRPLERYAIHIADDGQVEVDKSQTFQQEMGEWSDPACFIPA